MDDEPEMSPQQPRLATAADFDATDFEAPIRDSNLADAHDMYGLYERAFAAAQAAGDDAGQLVYRLLAQVCSIALRPSDEGNNWLPLLSFTDGTHSPITEDFRGAQTELLRDVAQLSKTPALRARLSDIAWSNHRRDGASATAAIEAYCETVDGLLDGHLTSLYGLNAGMAAKTPMHRALQIAWLTTKATSRPQRVIDNFDRLYTSVRDRGDVGILVHLARLALQFRLKDAAALAPELEQAAKAVPHGSFPMAVKSAWDMAARLYDSLKDPEARQRCLMGGVEQLLAMRGQVSTAGAEASWVLDALQLLRHVQGQEELELKLEAELRRLQKASMKQMAMFEVDLEVGDTPRKVAEHFERLSLSDALRAFALLDRSRDVDKLRADAVALGETAPFMATMPTSFIDNDGRTVKKSPGAPHEGEPDEVWFTHMIERSESIHRHRTIAALIEPARLAIQARYGLVSDYFQGMVASCPFVPESQRELVALGFARLFQGDFMSATHLLIPQLEPCLRHLLKINGADPSKRSDDSTEQDLSLKNIYVRFREELGAMLTPDLAWEIDRLFNTRPGPALRHEVAHGQLSGGDCFHPNVYYANWLIYRVCCLFAFPSWDELVAPDLAE
ncbi:MAG: hypothetical protein P4M05_26475 [Bradyrhizobium sp.]|nr:hypothetical protein [Bradyrhizobium sp.]